MDNPRETKDGQHPSEATGAVRTHDFTWPIDRTNQHRKLKFSASRMIENAFLLSKAPNF